MSSRVHSFKQLPARSRAASCRAEASSTPTMEAWKAVRTLQGQASATGAQTAEASSILPRCGLRFLEQRQGTAARATAQFGCSLPFTEVLEAEARSDLRRPLCSDLPVDA